MSVIQHTHFNDVLLLSDVPRAQVPGVPIMYINSRKYSIERMPEAFGAPKN
jgi:U3 small nucleolar RNA-associated protein 24